MMEYLNNVCVDDIEKGKRSQKNPMAQDGNGFRAMNKVVDDPDSM